MHAPALLAHGGFPGGVFQASPQHQSLLKNMLAVDFCFFLESSNNAVKKSQVKAQKIEKVHFNFRHRKLLRNIQFLDFY